MKKTLKHLSVCALFVFVIFISAFSFSTLTADAALTDPVEVMIFKIDLGGLTAPKAGELPDTEIYTKDSDGWYYVSDVSWLKGSSVSDAYYFMQEDEAFEPVGKYRVGITITAKTGYKFTNNANTRCYIDDKQVMNVNVIDSKEVLVVVDYDLGKYVYNVGVNGLAAPKTGELPDTSVTPTTEGYTASVKWYDQSTGKEHSVCDPFKAEKVYRAEITLDAKSGTVFPEVSRLSATVDGVDRTGAISRESDSRITVVQYFTATARIPVTKFAVTLDAPRPGETPDFTAEVNGNGYVRDYNENGYIHGVKWTDYFTGRVLTAEDTFAPGGAYYAWVYMVADEDHTFDGMQPSTVNVNAKVAAWGTAPDGGVAYSKIGKVLLNVPNVIDNVSFTDLKTPLTGNTPDYWLNTDDGIVIEEVVWGILTTVDGVEKVVDVDENHRFVEGATYCLTLKIRNDRSGYVFGTVLGYGDERYVAFSADIDGKDTNVVNWQEYRGNALYTYDPYNYADVYCWYTCKTQTVSTVTAFLDTPVAGNTPDYSATIYESELSPVKVIWYKMENGSKVLMQDGETFVRGGEYFVHVIFRSSDDYRLDYDAGLMMNVMSGTLNWNEGTVCSIVGNYYHDAELQCAVICNDSYIDQVGIGSVTAPVAGELPNYDIDILGDGYYAYGKATSGAIINGQWVDLHYVKNGVYWYDVTADREVYENESFIGGHTYRVRFTLYTNNGYYFSTDNDSNTLVTATVNGQRATAEARGWDLYVYYEFVCPTVGLDKINVEIAAPAIGDPMSWDKLEGDTYYSVNSDGWEGMEEALNGIVWGNITDDVAYIPGSGEFFAENTEYSLVLHVTLKEGYYINDADNFEVYLNGLRMYDVIAFENSGNILIVYTFPHTDCICEIVAMDPIAPTCTESGLSAHYACVKCGQTYKDAEGEELLDEGELWGFIPPTGHNFANYDRQDVSTHLSRCACGEMKEESCEFTPVLVMGPSMYSRYDCYVYTCTYCGNQGSFYVDYSQCDHELTEWETNFTVGGIHSRTCACGWAYEEEECDCTVTLLTAPNAYSEFHGGYLYTCTVCGSESFNPAEGQEIPTTDSIENTDMGVSMVVPPNSDAVIPEGTEVVSIPLDEEDFDEDTKAQIESAVGGEFTYVVGYDIGMYYEGFTYVPTSTITVIYDYEYVPKLDEWVYVVYVGEDGSATVVTSGMYDYSEQYYYFDAEHFSKYIVVVAGGNDTPVECQHNYMDGSYCCSACGAEMPKLAEGICDYTHDFILWENGDLVIIGDGFMDDFKDGETPWNEYKSNINRIIFEGETTYIGANAFGNLVNLTEVTLPSALISIGEYAFYNTRSLNSIELPEKLISIGKAAFRNSGLTSVSFNGGANGWYAGIINVSSAIEENGTAAAYLTVAYSTVIWARNMNESGSEIAGGYFSWSISDTGVLTISGKGAMPNYNSDDMPWADYRHMIVRIEIGEGITSVGRCAFYGCTALKSVSLPISLNTIEEYAFYSCSTLTEITIPRYVSKIGAFAFRRTELTTVNFERNYGWSAGEFSFSATEIYYMGAGYLTLGYYKEVWVLDYYAASEEIDRNFAYGGMCNTEVKWTLTWIDENRTQLKLTVSGNGAMPDYGTGTAPWCEYAAYITEIEVGEGVTSIGRCAFYALKAVSTVTLHEGLTSIGDYAFNTCYKLTEIVIPSTVTKIGTGAFGKTGLTEIPTV